MKPCPEQRREGYQVADRRDSRALAEFLSQACPERRRDGPLLLPLLELIEQAELAVDELIDVAGRATIEALLTLSARQVAGSKYCSAIDALYGTDNPVQRCRNHKVANVLGYVPAPLRDQVGAAMKAAYRLEADQGMAQLEKQAQWLDTRHPDAAASLREGPAETFTVNRLGLPASLRRCLGTTNVIESPNGTVRQKIGRVRRRRDGAMVLRWAASAFLASEKSFRRLMGWQQLWMLQAYLNDSQASETMDRQKKVG